MGTGVYARVPAENCPNSGGFCPRIDEQSAEIWKTECEIKESTFKRSLKNKLGGLAADKEQTVQLAKTERCPGATFSDITDTLQCGLDK